MDLWMLVKHYLIEILSSSIRLISYTLPLITSKRKSWLRAGIWNIKFKHACNIYYQQNILSKVIGVVGELTRLIWMLITDFLCTQLSVNFISLKLHIILYSISPWDVVGTSTNKHIVYIGIQIHNRAWSPGYSVAISSTNTLWHWELVIHKNQIILIWKHSTPTLPCKKKSKQAWSPYANHHVAEVCPGYLKEISMHLFNSVTLLYISTTLS